MPFGLPRACRPRAAGSVRQEAFQIGLAAAGHAKLTILDDKNPFNQLIGLQVTNECTLSHCAILLLPGATNTATPVQGGAGRPLPST